MSIKDLNCMIHYGDGNWVPAQRRQHLFFDPAGNAIHPPETCRDMSLENILRVMDGVKREKDAAKKRQKAEIQ